jgi:ubiquitin
MNLKKRQAPSTTVTRIPIKKQTASASQAKNNRAKRRAALASVEHYAGDVIIPAKRQVLQEADVEELTATVKAEAQKRYIGELVQRRIKK